MNRYLLWVCCGLLCLASCLLCACSVRRGEMSRTGEPEFTVLDREDVPPALEELIDKNEEKAFRLTYIDGGYLYIAEGYGAQPTTGYSVEVKALYETDEAVCFQSELIGPDNEEEIKNIVTYPYVAVKLEAIEKEVLFE